MNAFFGILDSNNQNRFKVDYPYFGLFGTADVTLNSDNQDPLFECRLRNGQTIKLKKIEKKWFDVVLNQVTPLSIVIGSSIDDFLRQ